MISALLLSATSALPAALPTAQAAGEVQCEPVSLPVSLGLLSETVRGQFCRPADRIPTTVQLLVHGGTYNRQYWDIRTGDGRYSYQRQMAARGFATLAIDCLGSGDSSQPLSLLLTGSAEADVVHQVVGKLRAGRVAGTRFDDVVLVGHSMGSGIVVLEASTYRDVDGVVLTGMTHSMDLLTLTGIFIDGVRPALLDPRLSQRGGDPGYVTTMPGTRGVFYQPGLFDPAILAADEAVKDQVPATVVPDLLTLAFTSPLSRAINVPVLIANGDKDALFCTLHCASEAALQTAETPYFSSELTVRLSPNAGHSVALSEQTEGHRAAIQDWLSEHFSLL